MDTDVKNQFLAPAEEKRNSNDFCWASMNSNGSEAQGNSYNGDVATSGLSLALQVVFMR